MPSLGDILNTVLQEARNTRDTLLDAFAGSTPGRQQGQETSSFEEILAKVTVQAQVPGQVLPEATSRMAQRSVLSTEAVLEKGMDPAPPALPAFSLPEVEALVGPRQMGPSADILPRVQEALSSLREGLSRLVSLVSDSLRRDARETAVALLSSSSFSGVPYQAQAQEFLESVAALVKDLPETQNPLLLPPAQQDLMVGQWIQQAVAAQQIQFVGIPATGSPIVPESVGGDPSSDAILRFSFQETDIRIVQRDGSRITELYLHLGSFQMTASFHQPAEGDTVFMTRAGNEQPAGLPNPGPPFPALREMGSLQADSNALSLPALPVSSIPPEGMNRTFKDLVGLLLQSGVTRAVLNNFMVPRQDSSHSGQESVFAALDPDLPQSPVVAVAPRLLEAPESGEPTKRSTVQVQQISMTAKPEAPEIPSEFAQPQQVPRAYSASWPNSGLPIPEQIQNVSVASAQSLPVLNPFASPVLDEVEAQKQQVPLAPLFEGQASEILTTRPLVSTVSGLPLGLRDQQVLVSLPLQQVSIPQGLLAVQPEQFGELVQESLIHSGVVLPSPGVLTVSTRAAMPVQAASPREVSFSPVSQNLVQDMATPAPKNHLQVSFAGEESLPDLTQPDLLQVEGNWPKLPVLNLQVPATKTFEPVVFTALPASVASAPAPVPTPVLIPVSAPAPAVSTQERAVTPLAQGNETSSHRVPVLLAVSEAIRPIQLPAPTGTPIASWNGAPDVFVAPASVKPISPQAVTQVPVVENSIPSNLPLDGNEKELPALPFQGLAQSLGPLIPEGDPSLSTEQAGYPKAAQVDPRVDAASVLGRVTDQVSTRASELRALSHLSFQLIPESLGRVTVQLALVDHALSARIIVTRPEVREALQNNLVELRTSLNQAGLQIDQLQVQVQGGGANLLAQYFQYQQEGSGYRLPVSPSSLPEEQETVENKGFSGVSGGRLTLVDVLA